MSYHKIINIGIIIAFFVVLLGLSLPHLNKLWEQLKKFRGK